MLLGRYRLMNNEPFFTTFAIKMNDDNKASIRHLPIEMCDFCKGLLVKW